MTIRDALMPLVKARFGDLAPTFGVHPAPVVVFKAAHPKVGDVSVWDEGGEATVAIGMLTHSHFNPYDDSLSGSELSERVAADVVEFLADLFDDRVVLYTSLDRRSGGWTLLESDAVPPAKRGEEHRFLWSGPLSEAVPHQDPE